VSWVSILNHEQKEERRPYPGNPTGRGGRPVEFNGKHYGSIASASRANGIDPCTLRRKLGLKKDGRKRHDAGAIRERDCPTIHGRKWRPEEVVECAGYEIPVFSQIISKP
jgi:hypothetical protein